MYCVQSSGNLADGFERRGRHVKWSGHHGLHKVARRIKTINKIQNTYSATENIVPWQGLHADKHIILLINFAWLLLFSLRHWCFVVRVLDSSTTISHLHNNKQNRNCQSAGKHGKRTRMVIHWQFLFHKRYPIISYVMDCLWSYPKWCMSDEHACCY